MPELPELHIFARNLDQRLSGHAVTDVRVWRTRHRNFKNQEIKEALNSRRLKAVRREGKQVHFDFEGGRTLAVHLMLCGEFSVTPECVFRRDSTGDSGRIRPLIPGPFDHPFRPDPTTHSGRIRPPVAG